MDQLDRKSLMLGDWVLYDEEYYIVSELCYNDKVITLVQENKYSTTEAFASENLVTPIPLTAEILEKNGLKLKRNDIFGWYEYRNGDEYFSLEYTGDSKHYDGYWSFAAGNKDCDVCMIVMHSVHELQHALRLCKIDKEIEL